MYNMNSINNIVTINLSWDEYEDLLEQRRIAVADTWNIPNPVWEYFVEVLRECGVDPNNANPSYLVDNLAVNASWERLEDVRNEDEDTDELIERLENEGYGIAYGDDGDDYVIFNL